LLALALANEITGGGLQDLLSGAMYAMMNRGTGQTHWRA
jgi:hypothetical protein